MRLLLLLMLALAACAPVPPVTTGQPAVDLPLIIPTSRPPQSIEPGFDRASIEADLLASARELHGEPLVRRAIAAPAFLFTKHYPGMMPPPPPDSGPGFRYPAPPVAMLFRENAQWLAATSDGVRPARAEKVAEIEAILANPAFWAEPIYAAPGCTDAGASLLMLKVTDRPRTTRRGACNSAQLGENLVFRALES